MSPLKLVRFNELSVAQLEHTVRDCEPNSVR